VQVRTLQAYRPPVRVLIPGNVYRRDFFDATHAPAFAQVEGLAVDEGVSFVDLKATLAEFARRFYGGTRRVRFGPSYFPFTEPVGADGRRGRPARTAAGLRWVEILGCGMVHPNVLEAAGVDSERYTGWAFGMGPARIAMSRTTSPTSAPCTTRTCGSSSSSLSNQAPRPRMLASHEWLKAFVPHALPPAEVGRLLSAHVATLDSVESLRADLAPLVVARVVESQRVPTPSSRPTRWTTGRASCSRWCAARPTSRWARSTRSPASARSSRQGRA
jgi:hypothetical protein